MRWEEVIQAALEDPYIARMHVGDYVEPPHLGSLATFDLLKQIARKPIVAVIIETRVTQLSEFARPQSDPRSPGFVIAPRDGKMTEAAEKEARRLERWLMDCGDWSWAKSERKHAVYRMRLTFDQFIQMIMRDSLRYDQAAAEIVWSRAGKPLCFLPVDASTIRYASDGSGYVQVVRGVEQVAFFEPHELMFGVRRPRSDLEAAGYGYPELLELAEIITSFLWGYQYNANYFRQGMNTKGILVVTGPMNPEQLQTLRRDLQMAATGVGAAHRVPILNPADKNAGVQWLSLGRQNADMEFREWMNWLLKVICGLYLMDPAEIGFSFGSEGQRDAVFQTNPESRVQMGRDKGLRTLLRKIESWIMQWIIEPMTPDFEFRFVGIGDFREKDRASFDRERLSSYMTVDEIRAEHQLPPLPGNLGKIPGNPTLLHAMQVGAGMGALDMNAIFATDGGTGGGSMGFSPIGMFGPGRFTENRGGPNTGAGSGPEDGGNEGLGGGENA